MLARILPKMNTVCSLQFAVCSLIFPVSPSRRLAVCLYRLCFGLHYFYFLGLFRIFSIMWASGVGIDGLNWWKQDWLVGGYFGDGGMKSRENGMF